jgi:hypothetical protein
MVRPATAQYSDGFLKAGPRGHNMDMLRRLASAGLASAPLLLPAAAPPEEKDPPRYNHVFLYDASTGSMEPLLLERARQKTKGAQASAWIEGERSRLRRKAGSRPVLVIAYSFGLPPAWAARAYRFRVDGGRRIVRLDVRSYSPDGQLREGRLAVKMEQHGRLSMRLVPPWPLPPGENASSTPAGTRAFTFGVDP